MARIIVLGAGICGLATGMVARRDGHEVTVLERDEAHPPLSGEQAWERWARDGVTQFRQPHYLQSRGRIVLEEALPDVAVAVEAAGGLRFDPLNKALVREQIKRCPRSDPAAGREGGTRRAGGR